MLNVSFPQMFVNAAGEDTPIDVVPAMDDSVYSFPGNPLQTIQHRAYANTRLLCCRNFEVFTRKRWTFPNESYIGVYYKNTGSWLFYKLLRLFGCSFVFQLSVFAHVCHSIPSQVGEDKHKHRLSCLLDFSIICIIYRMRLLLFNKSCKFLLTLPAPCLLYKTDQ